MYAIISDGGRQFKVEEGQELTIDYRADAAAGEKLTFDQVLAVSDGAGSVKLGSRVRRGARYRRSFSPPPGPPSWSSKNCVPQKTPAARRGIARC